MPTMILSLPWLVIPIILYNLIAFTSSSVDVFNGVLVSVNMISGATWSLTVGDSVILITLTLLFVELVKATRTGGSSIVDHALSMILFIICIIEFLVVPAAATS